MLHSFLYDKDWWHSGVELASRSYYCYVLPGCTPSVKIAMCIAGEIGQHGHVQSDRAPYFVVEPTGPYDIPTPSNFVPTPSGQGLNHYVPLSKHRCCGAAKEGLGRATGMLRMVSVKSLKSFWLAPATHKPTGTPLPSTSSERLVPLLARSVGLGPVFFPTQRRLALRPVQRQPRPVDADQCIVGQKPLTPERREYPRLRPFLEPAMG